MSYPNPTEIPSRSQRRKVRLRSKSSSIQPKWLYAGVSIIALCCLVSLIVWYFFDRRPQAAESEGDGAIQQVEATQVLQPNRPDLKLEKVSQASLNQETWLLSHAEQIELELKVLSPTTVTVREGSQAGKVVLNQKVMPGKTIQFRTKESFQVKIQDPKKVQLLVNGIVVDTQAGTSQTLYHFKLK